MGRIPKWRRVAFILEVSYFKSVGNLSGVPEEVRLSIEEAEALYLKDLEGLGQEKCAKRVNIALRPLDFSLI